jgi:colanic acid biosynthesis glycosyl transferase WcaI
VPDEYRGGRRRSETLNGVKVWRVPIYVPAHPGGATRLLHLLSFALSALPLALRRARALKPDMVLTVAPALFSAPVALWAARAAGAKRWLHIQDFELDAAFELGLLKGRRARSFGERIERAILSRFDTVSTISPRMVERLLAKGVAPTAALEIRNWVDLGAIRPLPSTDANYRRELAIPAGTPVLLYSGNMGAKQGLETLASAARILAQAHCPAVFLFVGNGPYRAQLEQQCQGLATTLFLDLQPAPRLCELLATADIHLLPQRRQAADLVLPSKLPPMLASGRPCIVLAEPGTGLAEEVGEAGMVVPPGDADALAAAILVLLGDGKKREQLAASARRLAETRWGREVMIDRFEAYALSLAMRKTGS